MEEKRKVKFTLEGANVLNYEKPGMFDYESEEECENAIKVREGVFHQFGTVPNGDNILSCAIVEDCSDGKVYCVPPQNIQFV